MASLSLTPSARSSIVAPQVYTRSTKLKNSSISLHGLASHHIRLKHVKVCCKKLPDWESSPIPYAPTEDADGDFLKETSNIFETLKYDDKTVEATNEVVASSTINQTSEQLQVLKWPLWILGPCFLLTTGMVPTLWLPLSSIFLGPNIASLLSLVGLDLSFNLGATLFLLMADSSARPKNKTLSCNSKAPFSYKFWNLFATISGFIIPFAMLFGSHKGLLQPLLPNISFTILLGPYLLLLAVQALTEMLTWQWQSPVWLVTPIVYEAYRVLQLMRGLKLGAELNAPLWMVHTIRGLVLWWLLILGVQLMRVAWFAGYSARTRQLQEPSSAVSEGT
ncbi:hypothetical protein RJ641_017002 [Dillenia turbinata]|uniref:Cytochrome P450 family protein n=1 Tax=Dillenia turbinata TaxID=194707 RepID=A0AAN8UMZ3_9MAGN